MLCFFCNANTTYLMTDIFYLCFTYKGNGERLALVLFSERFAICIELISFLRLTLSEGP